MRTVWPGEFRWSHYSITNLSNRATRKEFVEQHFSVENMSYKSALRSRFSSPANKFLRVPNSILVQKHDQGTVALYTCAYVLTKPEINPMIAVMAAMTP